MSQTVTSSNVRASLDAKPWKDGVRHARFTLRAKESAWNPASTKSDIHGPAFLRYTEHADGGIETTLDRNHDFETAAPPE